MWERFVVTILVPALLMLTSPFINVPWQNGATEETSTPPQARALLQAVLLGVTTDENELIAVTRTAPDEVAAGDSFTVTEEIRAKVDLEGAAIVAVVPEGFQVVSGDLRGFVGATAAEQVFTHTYELRAPEVTGEYTITATVRAKPIATESVVLTPKSLPIRIIEANRMPVALFVPSPLNARAIVDETFIFNGTTSFDLDGEIAEYQWNFGDGTTLVGPGHGIVEHAYSRAGTFTVSLVVVDREEKESLPKIQRVTVTEGRSESNQKLETAVIVLGSVAVAAGLGYVIWKFLLSDQTATTTTTSSVQTSVPTTTATTTPPTTTTGLQTSDIESKAEEFLSDVNLSQVDVTSVRVVAQVSEANRMEWIGRLVDQSVIIESSQDGVLTLTPYPQLSPEERSRVDLSFSAWGVTSLTELVGKRLAAGNTIVEITWAQANGVTFTSLAVISPSGIIKFDTFMTLDP